MGSSIRKQLKKNRKTAPIIETVFRILAIQILRFKAY